MRGESLHCDEPGFLAVGATLPAPGIAREHTLAPRKAKVRTLPDEPQIWEVRLSSKGEIVNDSGETLKAAATGSWDPAGLTPRNGLDAKGKAERKRFVNTRSVDEKRMGMYDKGLAGRDEPE